MRCVGGFTAAFLVVLACVSGAQADVVMETVPVGNPGNPGDTRYPHGDVPSFGGVDYTYNIGKYEVTAGQYTEFLNAVAKSDPYGLYNPGMDSWRVGCQITQHGSSGSYWYDFSGGMDEVPGSTEAHWADRPVNGVSWGDAARFANWLHNGQPTGAQGWDTTEDGSYFLDGATSSADLLGITREADATWVIPSEDEWYKAAYHKNDGATGNYFDYPTSTNGVPSNDLIDPDPGNNANFYDSGSTIGSPYNRTEVGDFENSESPYHTFDQGGNVWEWNEAIFYFYGSLRGTRGGSYSPTGSVSNVDELHAAVRHGSSPVDEWANHGFRVAEVLAPAAPALDIKPGSCPNSFNRNSNGVLPVALLGSNAFDVSQIDLASVTLSRADGVGGSAVPNEGPPGPHSVPEDAGTPFDGQLCDCHQLTGDGFIDLSMKFRTTEVVAALELDALPPGDLVELTVSGNLLDGTTFEASDCVRLVPPGTPPGELLVDAGAADRWIDADPLDLQLDGGGFDAFARTYPLSIAVTITAPPSVTAEVFFHWVIDGLRQPDGLRTITLLITQEQHQADAIYRLPSVGDLRPRRFGTGTDTQP